MAFTPMISAGLPGSASAPTVIGPGRTNDRTIAHSAASHLLSALASSHDTALRATLSTALAQLHKYLAQDEKETHQALAGKISPKLMGKFAGSSTVAKPSTFAPTLGR